MGIKRVASSVDSMGDGLSIEWLHPNGGEVFAMGGHHENFLLDLTDVMMFENLLSLRFLVGRMANHG